MMVTDTTRDFVEAMNAKFADPSFRFEATGGRNYDKVISVSTHGSYASRSVHAFIDRKSHGLLKPASWSAPAKGVRYDLSTTEALDSVVEQADKFGGYLYAR